MRRDKPSILITGSTGAVGQELVRALGDSYHLILPNREQLYERGYLDSLSFTQIQAVVHLASAHPRTAVAPTVTDYLDCINLTQTLIAWVKKTGVKTFVYSSTQYLDEDQIPMTDYSASKYFGERLITTQLADQGSVFILRFPGLLTAEVPPRAFISEAFQKLKKNQTVIIYDPDKPFPVVDPFEPANIIKFFIENPKKGLMLHSLIPDDLMNLKGFVHHLAKSIGSQSEINVEKRVHGVKSTHALLKSEPIQGYPTPSINEILKRFLSSIKELSR